MGNKAAKDGPTGADAQIRDRSIRLFTFLKELTELRSKTVRTIDEYDKVLWFSEIPQLKECYCVAWEESDRDEKEDVWLEIAKPRLKKPPKVPKSLEPWLNRIDVEDSKNDVPDLRGSIVVSEPRELANGYEGVEETKTIYIEDCPEIKAQWDRYVQKQWRPWAEEDRPLQVVQERYGELFSIYQKQQRLGEAFEVVLGLGLLSWKTRRGQTIRRHIITRQTSITFSPDRGLITIRVAAEGAKTALEQDMLDPGERPDPKEQKAIEDQIEDMADALWDSMSQNMILKSWIHAASDRGSFSEDLAPPPEIGEKPVVHLAPAVILRRRTERNLIRVFREIIAQLEDGAPVPKGVKELVTIVPDGKAGIQDHESEGSVEGHREIDEEIYFPLPSNEEQREISRQLLRSDGVLVQGPPGTGKSQSIANLVAHMLATGQRILVTSHTARALSVLRDKIPDAVSSLCVMLLGDDRESLTSLEDSVREITDHYNSWDEKKNRNQIRTLESKLDGGRRKDERIRQELRALREQDSYIHADVFATYEGTLQSIAQRLKDEEEDLSWILMQPDLKEYPPLPNKQAVRLLQLLRQIDKTRELEVRKKIPAPGSLPDPDGFEEMVKAESKARSRWEAAAAHREHPSYHGLSHGPRKTRETLIDGLGKLINGFEAIKDHIQPWTEKAALEVLADKDRIWRDLYEGSVSNLEGIEKNIRAVSQHRISGMENRDETVVRGHAESLHDHLCNGGKFGIWPFRAKVVSEGLYLLKEVRVDGHLCNDPPRLQSLISWIKVAEGLEQLRRSWSRCCDPPKGTFAAQVAEYRDLCEPLEEILGLYDQVETLRGAIQTLADVAEPRWSTMEELAALKQAAEAVKTEEQLKEARRAFDKVRATGRLRKDQGAHRVVADLGKAIESRNVIDYAKYHSTFEELRESKEKLAQRDKLLERMKTDAPEIHKSLESNPSDSIWDTRLRRFVEAWNWAKADEWRQKLSDPEAQEKLVSERERNRDVISKTIEKLAAAKAWGYCLSRVSAHEKQHLLAWAEAIRKIGKGTGKYVSKHREAARGHMEECRSAIPAWVMPVYRVAESVKPGDDRFDVVIIDEASQSGAEALFLNYLASKIIVVGDDKQIAPEFLSINRENVDLLRQKHIADLPISNHFDLDTSFFAHAKIRLPKLIRLREHFRCMPEIIQYSNNLCYRSEPLIPLRQYGTDRLKPVIVAKYVREGYMKGRRSRGINPPEAEALVGQICGCCADDRYEGKSMGVISLRGEAQARHIESLLLDHLGPEEMQERHLVCGDAYAFQGDERDVMFLSMVSAPTEGHRIGTLAKGTDERRFNVAVSRARDQVWLFHSATLNDLSQKCLRHGLLEYFRNPQIKSSSIEGIDIDQIKGTSRTNRDGRTPPDPFESWFQVDVFLKIVERGFRVIPEFEIAGYRIDLVVEGMRGRLAVECDGDSYHGLEQYDYDMERQRTLERCGWTFWRVRGGTFYRDPDGSMEGLWQKLKLSGIRPEGEDEPAQPVVLPVNRKDNDILAESRPTLGTKEQDRGGEARQMDFGIEEPLNSKGEPPASRPPAKAQRKDSSARSGRTAKEANKTVLDDEEKKLVEWVHTVPADEWFSIAAWAKEHGKLQGWQRSLAFTLGRIVSRKWTASVKQAMQGKRLHQQAMLKGYRADGQNEPS